MKFNIVSTRSDTVSSSGSFYDCPSKNAWTLKRVDGELKWLQYKTRPRNPKAQIWMGGDYGLIHIDHPNDLFSFDKKQIKELNQLENSEIRARKTESKWAAQKKFNDLLLSLRSQMRKFISNEIKKLDVSGECLISSDYAGYPAREKNRWPERDTSPYISETRFGLAFFQFNNRKEGVEYIEDWIDYTKREDWAPRVVVW